MGQPIALGPPDGNQEGAGLVFRAEGAPAGLEAELEGAI